jgi:hypothetical protein
MPPPLNEKLTSPARMLLASTCSAKTPSEPQRVIQFASCDFSPAPATMQTPELDANRILKYDSEVLLCATPKRAAPILPPFPYHSGESDPQLDTSKEITARRR